MNMQNILAQAKKMQAEITKKKKEIDEKLFPGKSEWVEVVFNGKRELVEFTIVKPGEILEDDKEILQDMVMIAIKDAFAKIEKEIEDKLGGYGESLGGMF